MVTVNDSTVRAPKATQARSAGEGPTITVADGAKNGEESLQWQAPWRLTSSQRLNTCHPVSCVGAFTALG